jgi:hypothetical protein
MASDRPALDVVGPTVTVRGEAEIRTEPDEAIVWISLSALDKSPGPALADVITDCCERGRPVLPPQPT